MSDLILPNNSNGAAPQVVKMHARMSDDVVRWVEAALGGCATGERVAWEVALALLPTPQGPQPGFLLLLQMASPVIGQNINHTVACGLDVVNEQAISGVVREGVEALRRARSQMLTGGGA